jgi:geranylgeranyl transferase type-2 subunit alpha
VREINVIEELLEIEPDSKCTFNPLCMLSHCRSYLGQIGCLDTLVHYKSLLLQHVRPDSLIPDCVSMLTKLESLDPFRRGRYADLGMRQAMFPSVEFDY